MAGKIRDISAEKPARRRTFERAIDELAQFPGVVGVAWGQPQRQSRWLDRPSLVVHVRWKHEPRSASERIPRSLDGFETDVIEVTPAVTVSGFFDHSDDVVAPAGTASRTSTPTLLQIAGSKPVALVSAHATLPVIGRTFGSAEGAPVRLSDPKFGHADGVLASGACGRGLDFALAVFDGVDPALWASWHYAGGMPPVARRRTRLVYGESLYLYSNLTGRRCLLRGVYRQDLLHDVELEDPHVGPVNLGALLFVESLSPQWPFALPGDSGALVVDGSNRAVGVVVGTTTDRRWAYVMTLGNLPVVLEAAEMDWFFC